MTATSRGPDEEVRFAVLKVDYGVAFDDLGMLSGVCLPPAGKTSGGARRWRRDPGMERILMATTAIETFFNVQTKAGTSVSQVETEAVRELSSGGAPRYSRRLSDKILIAFHHACDQSDFEVAEQLLHILETMLTRRPLTPDGTRRRNMESLVAAHERLWHLRHPNVGDN